MARINTLLATVLALVALVLAVPIAHASTSVTVLVKSSTGAVVNGAVVYAYQNGKQVAKCTTNSSGICTLSLPSNTTTLFFVSYGSAKYAIMTVEKYVPAKVTIDASKMHYAKLLTNVKYNIPVKVEPIAVKTNVTLSLNATLYAKEVVEIHYPKTYSVAPFREVQFEKVKYDNVTSTNTTITLDLSSKDYEAVAYYKVVWHVAPNIYLFVGIGILFLILLIVLALTKGRRIKVKTVGTY